MPRTREKFTLMKSRRDNGQGSDSLTEEDNENDREGLDESKQKRCLSKKEAIAAAIGFAIVFVAILLFIIIAVVTSESQRSGTNVKDSGSPWLNKRLPSSTVPVHYTVQLQVDLQALRVTGTSLIDVMVGTTTRHLIVHAKDMSISVNSVKQNDDSIPVQRTFQYVPNDYYVIELSQDVTGRVIVDLNYNYSLSSDLSGFYNSSYVLSSGEKRTLACTQFEPTDARKAFPCFDEPNMKANFTISIVHDSKLRAVSNMPSKTIASKRESNMMKTEFTTSVRMSTYLVAFIVSDFVSVTGQTKSGLQISVWSRAEVINQTQYALDIAIKVLEYYEEFFGIRYPLPKLDLFAIPDFAAGAMENWGLVTYRETALLYNPNSSPLKSKQWVASVIAHELAHQWFGNLVTMKWWSDLWLNEGFASFVEYIGADHADPSVNMFQQFVIGDFQTALDLDSLLSSHPVEAPVSDPDEINSQFDDISYDKGASLLRMLYGYLGNVTFLSGIKRYLSEHEYGNAVTDELWDSLESVSKPLVKSMMNTWTKQAGYPLVSLDENGIIRQERFFHVKPDNASLIPNSDYRYKWIVPITYITEKSSIPVDVIINMENDHVSIPQEQINGWIKLNVKQTTFARVNYDTQNWLRLIDHLRSDFSSTPLSPEDRAGLIDDSFALSDAGKLDIGIAMNLTMYLVKERHYVPWHTAIAWFNRMATRLQYMSIYGSFMAFVREIIEPALKEIEQMPAKGSNLNVYLKSDLFATATRNGNRNVTTMLTKMFDNFYRHNVSVDPNLKQVVYMAGVAEGGEAEWDFLWDIYQKASDPTEQGLILYALSCSRQLWILTRYLEYSISKVRSQDTLRVIGYVARNEHGLRLSWNFVRENWDYLLKKNGIGSFAMRRLIHTFAKGFTSKAQLDEFQSFFGTSGNVGGSRGVQQGYEYIKGNIYWFENVYSSLVTWLSNREYNL